LNHYHALLNQSKQPSNHSMKGKIIHNIVMADPVEAALQLKGFQTFRETPVRPGQRPPSIDITTRIGGRFIAFEFERSTDRVDADWSKADRIGAHLLVIVVPNAAVRERVRRALRYSASNSFLHRAQVQVMTVGATLQWVANNCPMPAMNQGCAGS
jgi:hypothetical protein